MCIVIHVIVEYMHRVVAWMASCFAHIVVVHSWRLSRKKPMTLQQRLYLSMIQMVPIATPMPRKGPPSPFFVRPFLRLTRKRPQKGEATTTTTTAAAATTTATTSATTTSATSLSQPHPGAAESDGGWRRQRGRSSYVYVWWWWSDGFLWTE